MQPEFLIYLIYFSSILFLTKCQWLKVNVATQQKVDFSLSFCRFQCGEAKNENNIVHPKGYYWRDYYGIVPPDALAIGNKDQTPQTYIGVVYDPSRNGSFTTTIFNNGHDYVYTVLHGVVLKKTRHIQILCSMEPEKMIWVNLTKDNVSEVLKTNNAVRGGSHREIINSTYYPFRHFVTKTLTHPVSYAGFTTGLGEGKTMEYVLENGTSKSSDSYVFLVYSKMDPVPDKNSKRNWFSFSYNFSLTPGSFIPNFQNKVSIGSCSVSCTNGKQSSSQDLIKQKLSQNALKYFWKPNLIDRKEGLIAGVTSNNASFYIGQIYSGSFNAFDVGEYSNGILFIKNGNYAVVEVDDPHIFSSTQLSDLMWVNTTSTTFSKLDKSKLIPGGELDDGTQIFVGRAFFSGSARPGSIHLIGDQAIFFHWFGRKLEFQALMIK